MDEKALQEALKLEQEKSAKLLKELSEKDVTIASLTDVGAKLKKENEQLLTTNGQLLLSKTEVVKPDDNDKDETPMSIDDIANNF